ncbi:MAG: hypothetical protein GX542_14045 [Rhodococcus sp.]|nr:hypothetical protein [Rhodococcus sp. (in: high G+C Gram-positive bacteria)]
MNENAANAPRLRIPFAPACGALVAVWLSLGPSLLPRPALLQALACILAAALGYAVGALTGWVLRGIGVHLEGRTRRIAWIVFAVIAAAGTIAAFTFHLSWQRTMRNEIGVDGLTFSHIPIIFVVSLLGAAAVLAIARLLRAAGRFTGRQVARVLPGPVAVVLGAVLVGMATWWVVDTMVTSRILNRMDTTFIAINDEFRADLAPPTSPHVSGGPDSSVAWDDLGRYGRLFVINAPTPESISQFTGQPALEPVRAYAGIGPDGESDLAQQADIAVRELELMGGFDRAVLNVVTSTGRGWVNDNQVRALEYMWNGDTATVSIQYSYLPSWVSFLVDGERAQTAGRLLFDAVYEHWRELPEDARPLLVVSGESLGTFGAEAAFGGVHDLSERTDGALFVGPTGDNTLWSQFTAERDPGSPEVLPILQDGKTVRFSHGTDWDRPDPHWSQPRVGYIQHSDDPVTWWTWSLFTHKPDWLKEPRGEAVSPHMRWIPFITGLQVGLDQFVGQDVPAGYGHEFGTAPIYGWARILPPPGWSDADADRLADAVSSAPLHDDE